MDRPVRLVDGREAVAGRGKLAGPGEQGSLDYLKRIAQALEHLNEILDRIADRIDESEILISQGDGPWPDYDDWHVPYEQPNSGAVGH